MNDGLRRLWSQGAASARTLIRHGGRLAQSVWRWGQARCRVAYKRGLNGFHRLATGEAPTESSRSRPFVRVLFALLVSAAGIGLSALVVDGVGAWRGSMEGFGQFGDFLGGVLNPVFTFFTFFGLLITIVMQRVELRQAHDEYAKTTQALNTQAIENTFFSMVALHHQIVSTLTFDMGIFDKYVLTKAKLINDANSPIPHPVVGRMAFKDIVACIDAKSGRPQADVAAAYEFLQQEHNDVLGHYFRNLYQALKLIDSYASLEEAEKKKYAGILRAQLSSHELVLLFLNCLPDMVDAGAFRALVVRYRMLEHLPMKAGLSDRFLLGGGTTNVLISRELVASYLGQGDEDPSGAYGTHPRVPSLLIGSSPTEPSEAAPA